MTVLDEVLVRLGVDLSDTETEVDQAASHITDSLDSVSADGLARNVDRAADAAADSLDGISTAAQEAASDVGTKISSAAGEASDALDGVGDSAERAAADADKAADDTEGAFRGMAMAAAGAAVGAAFMSGLTTALDMSSAEHDLSVQLGLTADEAARAGDLAGDVFSAGFGESIEDVNASLGSVMSGMGSLGDLTDSELKRMTESAILLGEKFEMDIPEAATAAGALIKQGLVKDGTEAFDVLTRAAQTLPASMRADIPAIVTEYGTHFKRIGLDAKTAFGMMSQFVKAGGKDIDQAADVLHEFARITSEETDRAKAGFKALGLDAGEMLSDISKGGKPAADALSLTLDELRKVEDPAKRAQLGVELFGDMAGEAADALLAMDPATAGAASGMDTASGAAARANEAMQNSPAQEYESAMRTLSGTLGEALLPALTIVSGLLSEHPELIKILVPAVLLLAAGLGIAAAAQWAMNSAMLANPYTWLVVAIVALVVAIGSLWANWDAVTRQMGRAWDWTTGKFSAGWDWLVANVFNPIGWFFTTAVPGWVGDGVDWIVSKWNSMINWFAGVPGRLARGASGMWAWVSEGLKSALNSAIGLINDGIYMINANLIGTVNRLPGIDIPWIPYVPFLAEGGVATGPTLAMVGEGSESEAIVPLSKLEQMIDVGGAPSVSKVAPSEQRVVWELRGGSRAFREFFQESVRATAGGDVIRFAEG